MTIDEVSDDKLGKKQLTDDAQDDVDGHRFAAVDPDFDRQRVEKQPNEEDDAEGHVHI